MSPELRRPHIAAKANSRRRLSEIVQARSRTIINRWAMNPSFLVQVETPANLELLRYLEDRHASDSIGRLRRRHVSNVAFVRASNGDDDASSIWVRSGYRDYRAAYADFLSEIYGIEDAKGQLSAYAVDHLLNRARALSDGTFIRIEPAAPQVNSRWGSLFEKVTTNSKYTTSNPTGRNNMNYMICAKLAGQMPPDSPEDKAGIDRLVAFFASLHLEPRETEAGIRRMLDIAYERI